VPDGDGPAPVAVVIHGGFWKAVHGRKLMWPVCGDLARRGWAVWNLEYRRLGLRSGGGWPATFDDVAAAIDHLAQAADGRVRLDSLSAVGHSAGGQLALWAASRPDPAVRIRRVAALAAPCNLAEAGENAQALMGGTAGELAERYDAADPMRRLPLGVPILLVHGVEDTTVPVRRSREYAAAARAAGDEVELVELPQGAGGHRVHVDPRSRAWQAAAEWLVARASG
jgi:acetyl esterase/lipase